MLPPPSRVQRYKDQRDATGRGIGDPLADLAPMLAGYVLERHADDPPFMGGLVGLACYELAHSYERLPRLPDLENWPDLVAGLYLTFAVFDHVHKTLRVVSWEGEEAAQALAQEIAQVQAPASFVSFGLAVAPDEAFEAAVQNIIEDICAGELFQANISRVWIGQTDGEPYALWARWVAQSPAPYAAYLRLPAHVVMSNSPEKFIRLERQDDLWLVESQPIKGTRPRGQNEIEDRQHAEELIRSEKDRAENVMIVDLMRNDLSRVCVSGSVHVPELCALHSYPTVHHLVSTVRGQVQAGKTALDVLAATFPAGSVTGAPKIRAMQAISQYEQARRGPYCGSVFWLGVDGCMESSVLIRTASAVRHDNGYRVTYRAGGGITALSDPQEERVETQTKVSGFLSACLD